MGVMKFPNQINFIGRGYLDPKCKVYNTLEEIEKIGKTSRFKGYTVMVLSDGTDESPCEYWIPSDDLQWVKKNDKSKFSVKFDKKTQNLQLKYNSALLSEINLEDLFENSVIKKIEFVTENNEGKKGSFLKLTFYGKEKLISYIEVSSVIADLKAGTGINIDESNVISINEAWLNEHESSMKTDIENNKTSIISISDRINALSKGNMSVDSSLSYVKDDISGSESLGVKISEKTDNLLKKTIDGLAVFISYSGDDINNEII